MALSDCPVCWDTPCTCGHMGYSAVPTNMKCETCKHFEAPTKEDPEYYRCSRHYGSDIWLREVDLDKFYCSEWKLNTIKKEN